ncbi:MAG TPA: M12 family metallo-peptidase [Chthoniobacterales bacterium]
MPVTITSSQSLDRATKAHALAGRIDGVPLGRVAISVHGDAIYASIHGAQLGNFEIRRGPGGNIRVEKLTAASDLPCAADRASGSDTDSDTTVSSSTTPPSTSRTARAAPANVVEDIAIYFNDQARVSVGGAVGVPSDDADIRAKIQTSITDGNTALSDSNIAVTLRAVAVNPIDYDYPASEGMDRALAELRSTADGKIDEVHAYRDQVGADIVSLWIDSNVDGGLSNVNYQSTIGLRNAFNVVRAKNPTSTFVHEVGHNHGCRHLRDSYSSTPTSYYADSFAHYFLSSGAAFVTVVASTGDASRKSATRILRFSDPNLDYLGTPTGQEGTANNAATIRDTSILIADFRVAPETPSPTPTPSASPSPLPDESLPKADITPPKLTLRGRAQLQTHSARIILRGTASDDSGLDRVIYKVTGQEKFAIAKGTKQWKLTLRPRIGRTVVKIIAVDLSNLESSPVKVIILRTP